MSDGRLAVAVPASPFHDHFHVDRRSEFLVFESRDFGDTWQESDDPTIPYNWPGQNPRERYDRFADVMADGSYLCAGSVGWQMWTAERRAEAEQLGLNVRPHPVNADSIMVGGHKMFVQRSSDNGKTWTRREWPIPGFGGFQVHQVPQGGRLADGTILICCCGSDSAGNPSGSFVWRSTDDGETFRLIPMGSHAAAARTSETTFLEVAPGRILALSRTGPEPADLVQRWSEDKGLTWTYPLRADFWGYPAHLLMLRDGRVLCSYGHRREPMSVRAVLSRDGGETWDLDNMIILRDDGGTPNEMRTDRTRPQGDLGYPVSAQLADGSILTVYYITEPDGITHAACCRWEV